MSVHLMLRDLRICKSSARVSEGARGHNPRLGASIERRRQPYEDVVRMKSAATDLGSDGKAFGKSVTYIEDEIDMFKTRLSAIANVHSDSAGWKRARGALGSAASTCASG